MITEIEEKIVEKLEAAGLPVKDFDVKKGLRGLVFPSVFVATELGSFSKITSNKTKCDLKIIISIFFKHPKNEAERRKGINPIIEGIVQTLFLEKLGLEISAIGPKTFRNATTQNLADDGILLFQIELLTSFNFTKTEDEAAELLTVGLSYLLNGADEAIEADIVTLEGII
jgi:hypothetical protein